MTEEIQVPPGMIRIDCKADGLEGAYLLLPDRGWTIATIEYLKNNMRYEPELAIDWVGRWVKGMSLPVLDLPETEEGGPKPENPLTDPKALTHKILTHYMDGAILGFIISGITVGAQYTLTTSPFAVGVSLPGSVVPKKTVGQETQKKPRRRSK